MMFTLSENYDHEAEVEEIRLEPSYYEENIADIERTVNMYDSLSRKDLHGMVDELRTIEDKCYELLNKLIYDNNTVRNEIDGNNRLRIEAEDGMDEGKGQEIARIFNHRRIDLAKLGTDEKRKRAREELEFQKSNYERNLDKVAQIERDLLKSLDINRALRRSAKMVRDNVTQGGALPPPFSVDSLSKSSEFIASTNRNRTERTDR